MLTIGASHSVAAWRHFSSGTMSLSDVEYSRIRPQPVHVKLHVCNGSSWRTIANFGVFRSLCLMMWPAIFADNASGNRIILAEERDLLNERRLGKRKFVGRGRHFGRVGRLETRGRLSAQNTRQQERGGRHAAADVDAAASGPANQQDRTENQHRRFAL